MAASDYVPIFFKNRLHLAGRPQMSTRPSETCLARLGVSERRYACFSGVRTTSPSSSSLTLIWHDSREFGRTS